MYTCCLVVRGSETPAAYVNVKNVTPCHRNFNGSSPVDWSTTDKRPQSRQAVFWDRKQRSIVFTVTRVEDKSRHDRVRPRRHIAHRVHSLTQGFSDFVGLLERITSLSDHPKNLPPNS